MIKNVFSFQHDNILFLNNREPKFKFVCLQNLPDIRLHTFSTRKNHLGTGILIGIIGSSTEQCACYSNQNKEELADVDENKREARRMECHPAPRPTLSHNSLHKFDTHSPFQLLPQLPHTSPMSSSHMSICLLRPFTPNRFLQTQFPSCPFTSCLSSFSSKNKIK